jgi:outer membrane murein-binding lipoprotein Lpp
LKSLQEVHDNVEQVETKVDQVDTKVEQVETKVEQVDSKVEQLEAATDRQKFRAYVEATVTTAGGRACALLPLEAGRTVKLESVMATAYYDAGATLYLMPVVKKTSTGRLMVQHIPILGSGNDPTTGVRSGLLQLPLRLTGVGFAAAATGDIYEVRCCVQSSGPSVTEGSFVFTGTYDPAP